jgi:hypothetical protein
MKHDALRGEEKAIRKKTQKKAKAKRKGKKKCF